jgi:PAS domain S-box-containing protein
MIVIDRQQIDRAIECGELVPHFQPLVSLRTGELQGFELLARWRHPERGWIPPEEFIPAAEKDGWIGALTRALLQQSFCAFCCIQTNSILSVNISAVQLHDLTLPEQIHAIAAKCGFPVQRLTIEITESALANDLEQARKTVAALKEMGCKLALDDFGTGYSSLSQLQSLPFDELKVDRSFVGSMIERRDSRKIVAAVVGLGQSLGLSTAAEGVETHEQAAMLRWLGCELGQGWLYGQPVPVSKLDKVVAEIKRKVAAGPPPVVEGLLSHTTLDRLPAQRLAQLQAVYDGAPVGLGFLDRDLRYMAVNRQLANMNGRTMAEHLGRTVQEVIPEMFSKVEPFIRSALRGEAVSGVEMLKPSPDGGEDRNVLLSYEPARDEAGEVVGVAVALVDLTPMKAAQEALRQSEEHFRFMLELLPHIPWIVDPEGRALAVSRRWLDIAGTNGEQWKGFGWLDSLHPDDVEPTKVAMQQAFQTAKPIDLTYRVRSSAEAPWRRFRARGAPRIGPDGKIVCWYGCLDEVKEEPQP